MGALGAGRAAELPPGPRADRRAGQRGGGAAARLARHHPAAGARRHLGAHRREGRHRGRAHRAPDRRLHPRALRRAGGEDQPGHHHPQLRAHAAEGGADPAAPPRPARRGPRGGGGHRARRPRCRWWAPRAACTTWRAPTPSRSRWTARARTWWSASPSGIDDPLLRIQGTPRVEVTARDPRGPRARATFDGLPIDVRGGGGQAAAGPGDGSCCRARRRRSRRCKPRTCGPTSRRPAARPGDPLPVAVELAPGPAGVTVKEWAPTQAVLRLRGRAPTALTRP